MKTETKTETKPLDVAYFRDEIVRFRKLFGEQTFWAKDPLQRQVAVDAIAYVYLTIETATKRELQDCAELLQATLEEYNRREFMLVTLGKTKIA